MQQDNTPITLPQTQQQSQVASLEDFALSPENVLARKGMLDQIMKRVMKDGTHFGKVPGCGDKPTLLKPGAEAISSTFQLCPKYVVNRTDMRDGHREYEITCELYAPNGGFVGSGVGSCSTMEGKYRFRQEQVQGATVPTEYWDTRNPELLGGPNRKPQKRGGQWVVVERVEHGNPADYYNTVLKMGKKRAFVDAVLTATGASDIFTQDIEDMPETVPGARQQPVQKQTQGYGQRQPQGSAMNQMDDMPDHGQQAGQASERQRKAVFAICKSKSIDLNALCNALTDANSFGHPVSRINELNGQETSDLLNWLNDGSLDYLGQQDA